MGSEPAQLPPSSAKLGIYQPPTPNTPDKDLGEAAFAHFSSQAVHRQAKLFTSLGLRFFFFNGVYNPWLEGLEDQNNLREPGKVLKGTKRFASGVGYLGNILLF